MIIPSAAHNDIIFKALADGAKIELTTHGTSMFPYIWPNSTITVEKRSAYNIDEVIVFDAPAKGSFIAHRLVKYDSTHFTTIGDSCLTLDAQGKTEKILGVVTHIRGSWFSYNPNGQLGRLYGKMIRKTSPLSHIFCNICAKVVHVLNRILK